MKLPLIICLTTAFFGLTNPNLQARTWTDVQGRKVEAEYVDVNAGKVALRLANGKVVQFPFSKLSPDDQNYVKKQYGIQPKNVAKRIDSFINEKLKKEGIKANPLTTDEQFLRRAYLEITGTIPTFRQALDFLESENPDKRRILIDELLDSEGYISHSFNWFADMLRLVSITSDFYVYETYIDWIKQSIRENKPFDELVYEMLTSEGRLWDNPASGYYLRDRGMPLDNLSTTVALFLGTEITCAQCHDHPFEDWTQLDFYQLAAFLGQRQDRLYGSEFWQPLSKERARIESEQRAADSSLGEMGFVQSFRNVIAAAYAKVWDDPNKTTNLPPDYKYEDAKPGSPVSPRVLFGPDISPNVHKTPRIAFAKWLTAKENPMFALTAANRLWKRAFGLGLHEPLENIGSADKAQNPALLRYLEQTLKDLDFDLKEFLRSIYYSEAWQRQATLEGPTLAQIDRHQYHFQGPILKRLSAEQLWDSFLTLSVPEPMRYKRDVAQSLVSAINFQLPDISGQDSIERTKQLQSLIVKTIVDSAPSVDAWRREPMAIDENENLYKFAFAYLTRASEQAQPARPSHFLRAWGQSDRVLLNNANNNGSIPQILTMINGPFTQMLIKPDSLIFKTVGAERGSRDKMDNIYLSILSRYPEGKEKSICSRTIRGSDDGYADLIWALVNTREFLFIQ